MVRLFLFLLLIIGPVCPNHASQENQGHGRHRHHAVVHVAHVVEALASTGAKFGLEDEGAAGLSICPFRDYSSSHSTAADIKLCRTRYSLMLQRLVQESPTFRRGLLEEYDDDPDWVIEVISDHISSLKCAESILNMAKKYRNYDEAVQADQDFIDSIFDR